MNHLLRWLASGSAVFLIGAAPAAAAPPDLNILIVPAAETGDGMQGRAVAQLRRGVMTGLAQRGYAVFDGDSIDGAPPKPAQRTSTAATLPGRVAKTLSAGLDAVIVISARIAVRRGVYTSHIETRFGASLMDGRTGRFLTLVDSGPTRRHRIAAGCGTDCLRDLADGEADAAAERLVPAIARKLAELPRRAVTAKLAPRKPIPTSPPRYVLVFREFGAGDIAEIEKYLTVFPGFGEMQRDKAADGSSVAYRYRSDLDDAGLKRAIDRMLRHLRLTAEVTQTDRTVVVRADRNDRRSNDW